MGRQIERSDGALYCCRGYCCSVYKKCLAVPEMQGCWSGTHFLHKHQRAHGRDNHKDNTTTTFHPAEHPHSSALNRRFHASRNLKVLTKPRLAPDVHVLALTSTTAPHSCWQQQNHVVHGTTDAAEATAWRLHQYTGAQYALSVLLLESSTTLQIKLTTSSAATASCTLTVANRPTAVTAKHNGCSHSTCIAGPESS